MDDNTPQIAQDRELAARVAGGDQQAFDRFFKEYFPRLFRFTRSRANNDPHLAEEIVQRTMCIVVRKMGAFRSEALLFTWLCQLCRNETAAVFRQRHIEMRMAAMRTDLHGSIANFSPLQAVDSVLATTTFRYRVEGDRIIIER